MDSPNKKILVVEDDDMLRTIILNKLKDNYITYSASNGEEALRQIKDSHPDLIILDLLMPTMDGFEMLTKLRAMTDPSVAKTPVIIVSNLTDEVSIQKAEGLQIEAYFTKADVSFGILGNRIRRIFAQVKQP